MKRKSVLLLCYLVLSLVAVSRVVASSVSVDDVSYVTVIYDGDTFNTSKGWTIRLADIDTPEHGEPGYSEATAYLLSLIDGKEVYLDVDPDLDPYDRYVCLVYVRRNATHLQNVNLALVLSGHAVVDNYTNNQFNPADWTLYVTYSPLYQVLVDSDLYNVTIISNSTVSGFAFSQVKKQLSFNVTGMNTGYCNVTIPKDLLGGVFTVLVNDVLTEYTLIEDGTSAYLYFRYAHSTHSVHTVVIYLGDVTAKLSSDISCLISNSEVPMSRPFTVSGLILPTPSLSYGVVTLTYTQPDDTVLNRTVPIMSDGSYGDLYSPEIVGEWRVTASWNGDASLEGAISVPRTFTVTVARIDIPLEYVAFGLLCGVIIFLLYIRRR